jgi:tetratricopeptide (TPR) repeat protein
VLPSATGRQFLRTFSLVALAIAVMFAVDTFLAKMEQSETRVEAARFFAQGRQLLAQSRYAEAASSLLDALTIERNNRDYELALAQAQLGEGHLSDAATTLDRLLASDSTDGPANLNLARVLVKQGKIREAISYYHRAVYGSWPSDAAANRLKTRFELIDLLAQQNSKEELLGELLAVEDQFPRDVPTRLRMGQLFLDAGSAPRAAAVFEQILKEQSDNAAAYAGLGEADFARSDYRAAANDFSSALRLNPEDRAAAARLDLCNRVLALDPTNRRLDPAERFRRSHALLDMTIEAVEKCASLELLDQAHTAIDSKVAPAHQDARAESDLDLAEQLWQTRAPGCGGSPQDALALVLARAAK